MKFIGIDIGSFSVKVFELESSSKELQLVDYHEHILSNTAPGTDNEIAVIDILKSVAANNDPQSTKYILCLPQRSVSTRFKLFPFKERSKVLKSIPFELEEDIPFDLDECIFDAKFSRFRGSMSEVLASATPKKNVLKILDLVHSVGIDPDILSVEGLALANLVEDHRVAPPQETLPKDFDSDDENQEVSFSDGQALLSLGHSSTVLSVFRDGRMINVKTFDWGGADIIGAVSQRYRISYDEALREVQSKSFILTNKEGANRDQVIFSDTIANSFKPLIRDLKLFLVDLQSEFYVKVSQISILGGTSQVRNLNRFLTQSLSIKSEPLDIFAQFPQNQIEVTPATQSRAGLSLSLAIEGLKRPLNPATQLRRDDFEKKSVAFQVFWQKWRYTTQLAAIGLALFYVYAFTKAYFASEINSAAGSHLTKQAKAMGLKGSSARKRGIRRHVKNKKREISNRKALSSVVAMNSSMDLLNKLSQSLPSKSQVQLDLTQFEVKGERLSISGSVAEVGQLQQIESTLKSMARDGSIKRQGTRPTSNSSQIAFSYNLLVDRNFTAKKRRSQKKGLKK